VSPGGPLRRLSGAALAAAALLVSVTAACSQPAAPEPAAASPLSDWTAVVFAGDWRASEGEATQAFDNGRRDVARALIQAGFKPANVLQYSLRPPWPGDDRGLVMTDPRKAVDAFMERAKTARSGCLFYLTSHGSPEGANFGPSLVLTPDLLAQLIAGACPDRPAVVVVSACYGGIFLPELAGYDRLVMAAARKDRTSFGCGADDVHTYFDECFLKEMPQAAGFLDLPPKVKACVAAKEKATGMSPPSEPQTSIGPAFSLTARELTFERP
jgi:hypothetical protein